jgi:hypothetical protein
MITLYRKNCISSPTPCAMLEDGRRSEDTTMRKITDMVSESFIWGVGITKPRPGQERRAAVYITAILVFAVLAAAGMFFLLKDHMTVGPH